MDTSNYKDFTSTIKKALAYLLADDFRYGLFLLLVLFLLWKLTDLLFKPLVKKKHGTVVSLMKGCVKAFFAITILLKCISLSDALSGFMSEVVMSSSLIVVVLGFVFQEGLTNMVHGFILILFKPFDIGDRVQVTVDGTQVTGYIKSMDLRSTVITNVMNSSAVIVPNSKMDLAVIDNSYFDTKNFKSNFLDFNVTYESNLQKARDITKEVIESHPMVVTAREQHGIKDPVAVLVRDLQENGIALRATVTTNTVEENFTACSDIRAAIRERFAAEPDVDFARPRLQLVTRMEGVSVPAEAAPADAEAPQHADRAASASVEAAAAVPVSPEEAFAVEVPAVPTAPAETEVFAAGEEELPIPPQR